MPDLLTTTEAAAIRGVRPDTIRAWIERGHLRARKVGRDYLIRPADLERMRQRRPGRPTTGTRR